MSTISTAMASPAPAPGIASECSSALLDERVRRRGRSPYALIGADIAAALATAALVLSTIDLAEWPAASGAIVLAWVGGVASMGGYAPRPGVGHPVDVRALVATGAVLSVGGLALLSVAPGLLVHGPTNPSAAARHVLLVAVATPLLSTGSRWVAGLLAHPAPHRVLLAGHARGVRALLAEAGRSGGRRGAAMVPAGICLDGTENADVHQLLTDADDLPVELEPDGLMDLVRTLDVDAVIVAPGPDLDHADLRRWAVRLQDAGVDLLVAPGLRDVSARRLSLASLGGVRLLGVRPAPLVGPGRALKGLADRTAAAVLLMALAPLLGALALWVRRDSPGPALFRQTRVGRDGRHFTVLKFRTMCQDADRIADQLADGNEADREGVLFKMRRDPRITGVGATLRKYSLDELPQLVNVVRGEMSLVGPRPALPSEVAGYSRDLLRRLVVKPGLTGLWQVSGRSDLSWEETVRLDLKYVDNWSWSLDLSIAARTVTAVLSHRGAY